MIELGDRVKDRITGAQGIVISITEYLFGPGRQMAVQQEGRDNTGAEPLYIIEEQLELVSAGAIPHVRKVRELETLKLRSSNMFARIKQIPNATLHALRRALEKLQAEDLPPGQYRLRGRVTVEIDCWLRKGEPTTARLPVPKIQVLSLALERAGLDALVLANLIDKAAFDLSEEGADYSTPTIDLALEGVKKLMPSKDREGACVYTGQAKIVSFDET